MTMTPTRIQYFDRESIYTRLSLHPPSSADFIILCSLALTAEDTETTKRVLQNCSTLLKNGGVLFVHGRPETLPNLSVWLPQDLTFKYWVAVQSAMIPSSSSLPTVHAAVLVLAKGRRGVNIRRIRFPHRYCVYCGRTLKDWGGKSHLMHPEGYVLSDVWKDLPKTNNYDHVSSSLLATLLRLPKAQSDHTVGIVGPIEGIRFDEANPPDPSPPVVPAPVPPGRLSHVNELPPELVDTVHCGDATEILRRYPDNSVDLVFADPPYNLDKDYNAYQDNRRDEAYLAWCNRWLSEYIRVLKPTGSLYLLNLPKWAIHHAVFLNRHLYFQNWIVWDALGDPRGKLLPAHYALLHYTRQPVNFTFNHDTVACTSPPIFCLRQSCIRQRTKHGVIPGAPLTDIWWDIHRIKHTRDRDMHPCQLPEKLMERIIQLSTNEGDVVLDALCGAGTTPVVAARLGRHYVAADIDVRYVGITKRKLSELRQAGRVIRRPTRRKGRQVTKRELQLELRRIAAELERLPTPEDVEARSRYSLSLFQERFSTWGKALKAAKLELEHGG